MEQDHPRRPLGRTSDEQPLQQYRLYFLDGVGALVSKAHEFEAEDDERATHVAESWLEGRRAELWCRSRKIKAWNAGR